LSGPYVVSPLASPPGWPGRPPEGEPLRVLLVEDDPDDAFLVRELLAEVNARVELIVVTSVAQARERADDIDCVLLDLNLPDATGLTALREVLAIAARAAVCVLTGLDDEYLGVAAVAEGAQDYLTKGQVDGVLLTRALRYAVERKRAEENARRLREAEVRQAESARLERGLLPQPLMQTQAISLHSFYRAGRHRGLLGGDFYDVVQTGPRQVELMVGDVCGHGVDEAALGVELRVAWRALVLAGVADDAVLPAMEQVLISERAREEIFATVAAVRIDLAAARLTIRLAGHPPPLLTKGGETTTLHGGDLVLGVIRGAPRKFAQVDLDTPDWMLLMYTDGLIEGRSGEAGRLEVAGLRALLAEAGRRGVPREDLPAWLVSRAEEANDGPLADDVAMLLLSPGEVG
jgi:serine phosphatase RsbU (regulator of sigma subunit)